MSCSTRRIECWNRYRMSRRGNLYPADLRVHGPANGPDHSQRQSGFRSDCITHSAQLSAAPLTSSTAKHAAPAARKTASRDPGVMAVSESTIMIQPAVPVLALRGSFAPGDAPASSSLSFAFLVSLLALSLPSLLSHSRIIPST